MSFFQENNQISSASCREYSEKFSEDNQTYPAMDDNILLNISHNLKNNPGFYFQVLELMKQLNISVSSKAVDESVDWNQQPAQNESKSEEFETRTKRIFRTYIIPSPMILEAQANRELRKKTLFEGYSQWVPVPMKFEPPEYIFDKKKIIGLCSKVTSNINELGKAPEEKPFQLTDEKIISDQLKKDQFYKYTKFKSYEPGIKSNTLIVKNLSKFTRLEDLKKLFYRYIIENEDEIHIRQYTCNRKRYRCNVTFKLLANPSRRSEGEHLIEKARQETNGFLLGGRPIYVSYGLVENHK
ncbi:unnamed protein product [Diamesa hyperborea]